MSRTLRILVRILLFGALGWAAIALAYLLPAPLWLTRSAVGAFALFSLWTLFILRPFARGAGVALLAFVLVLAWFYTREPSNTGQWQPEVSQLAHGELDGDVLTLHNVRDFSYRSDTDFTEHWETRSYDLSKITGLDMYFSHWGSPAIAHTIMSWDFSDGQHLAISIETRKVDGQHYSTVAGFFRQYPIYYVAADERDVIGVRTNYRGENVWLFRLKAPPENARLLLLDYLKSMNGLAEKPEWYNALVDNCTTSIRRHVQHLDPGGFPFDWRLIVNGYLPELLYQRGSLYQGMPFEELSALSNIDAKAKASGLGPDFSARIREGLPSPRAPRAD
ncbi:MAG: DUF4105 domain-containing protein [Myxococcota bacterium]